MAESKQPEGSVWAIVGAPDGVRYLGYWDERTGNVHEALTVRSGIAMVQTHEGPRPQLQVEVLPVDRCFDHVTVRVPCPATFIEMANLSDSDRQEYTDLWDKTRRDLHTARMRRAGLVDPAGTHVRPDGIIHP